jgi:hypothetical protein
MLNTKRASSAASGSIARMRAKPGVDRSRVQPEKHLRKLFA